MKKIGYLILLVLLCITSCTSPESKATKADNRPNVVVILTDDQGWGDLSIKGNKDLQTTQIDNLGGHGLLNAISEILRGQFFELFKISGLR